jgi:hypothetical protein
VIACLRWRRVVEAEDGGPAARGAEHLVCRPYSQMVVDLADAGRPLDHVFGEPLLLTGADTAGERQLATFDTDFNVAGVDPWIVGQSIADFLPDALVSALVAAWATA